MLNRKGHFASSELNPVFPTGMCSKSDSLLRGTSSKYKPFFCHLVGLTYRFDGHIWPSSVGIVCGICCSDRNFWAPTGNGEYK